MERATFIRQMDAEHSRRDFDGDGRLTRAEMERFEAEQAAAVAQGENRALFARLDADRDGAISVAEFAALVPAPVRQDVSSGMQRFDGNRDGVITIVEYRAATLVNFDRLDADHDGVVTAAEVDASVPVMAGR